MSNAVYLRLEELHQYCASHGMHVELDVDDRSIEHRDHREIVRVRVTRDKSAMTLGRPRIAGSRVCTLATLDRACADLLAAL